MDMLFWLSVQLLMQSSHFHRDVYHIQQRCVFIFLQCFILEGFFWDNNLNLMPNKMSVILVQVHSKPDHLWMSSHILSTCLEYGDNQGETLLSESLHSVRTWLSECPTLVFSMSIFWKLIETEGLSPYSDLPDLNPVGRSLAISVSVGPQHNCESFRFTGKETNQ